MKSKILIGLTVCVVIAAAIFGLIKRQSYTDIVNKENFMEQMLIAELSAKLTENVCTELCQTLPTAPIILSVSPVEDMEYMFKTGRQKVCIHEVHMGDGLDVGQEIYVTFSRWSVMLLEKYDTVQCGFVNTMKKGNEYLVFLSDKIDGLDNLIVYSLFGESVIAPIFCYEELENVIAPTHGTTTYVTYSSVKNNEFFAETEEALQIWKGLKAEMLGLYPLGAN